jgi:light-regulated signal transduction histidine kinase (bacteriophytochrome)
LELGHEQAEIRVNGPLPTVPGREAMLMQVSSNLPGNAMTFVATGVTPRIEIWAETSGNRLNNICTS